MFGCASAARGAAEMQMLLAPRNPVRAVQAASLLTVCIVCSCVLPPPPPPGDITDVLSKVVLHPEVDCSRLRTWFGLDYLKLVDTPAELGYAYEEHFLGSIRGNYVRYWYLPAELDRGTVLIAHGAAGRLPCYLYGAQLLRRNGWSVAIVEFQGFGESTGEASFDTLIPDLEVALDFTRSLTGRERITLMGLSLGSIPAIALAANRPDAVNGLILDSPVALAAQLDRFGRWLGDTAPYLQSLDPNLITDAMISRVRVPSLFFENGSDDVTTPETVQVLYAAAREPKSLCRFPESEHAFGAYYETQTYTYCFETFLHDVWRNEVLRSTRDWSQER